MDITNNICTVLTGGILRSRHDDECFFLCTTDTTKRDTRILFVMNWSIPRESVSCDRREMKRWYWVEDVGRQEEREREANLG